MLRIAVAVGAGLALAVAGGWWPHAARGAGPAPECAQRVVSMAPHATETLFALGAGDRIVGVDDFSRSPASLADLPHLGAYLDPDLEGIVGLAPDLVVLAPGHGRLRDDLGELGLPAIAAPDTRLEDVFETVRRLGRAVCREAEAGRLERSLRAEIAEARAGAAGGARLRAVLVVDRPPDDLRQFFVAGPDNFLDDLLAAAGAENVFADAPHPFPQVSLEPILAADPDLVIELLPGADAERAAARVADWARLVPDMRAVRRGTVFAVTEPWVPVPGPSVGRAVRRLAELTGAAHRAAEAHP